ncbi:ammonium transporter NrgA (Membrane protein nrgA) (Protein amtB) [Staphylococcus aureus]|uniref:Ammonium transporter n=1 Tax=Staphylococcus aureus TaxID=1280 RepID=A0A8G2HX33_STAAU|nr:ammonium transporter NrgA (Membrane protein nrgA) (Protein amtB) [Staphylococcus aureus]
MDCSCIQSSSTLGLGRRLDQQTRCIRFRWSTVVHITSGVSGLVLAIMIGKGNKHSESTPHNLIITLIGGIFVWIGWYGFNVGSAFTFDNIAMLAFANTVISASAGAIGWLILEYIF